MPTKQRAHERGANIVEAALVIPLLLIILVGVVDMGRAYFSYITIINAAREGARWGVMHPTEDLCAKAAAEAQSNTPPINLASCDVETPDGVVSGAPVRVTVQTNFTSILGGIVGLSAFPISYSVAFPIF
jgi:Flp pilus assembly protein TadG